MICEFLGDFVSTPLPYDPDLDPACHDLRVMTAARRSPHWSTVRASHLAAHPECVACGARTALNVHHLLPFHLYPELELETSNLVTLCECPAHNCHLIWGHLLNWSAYNQFCRDDAIAFRTRMRKRLTA